jgi:C-terminal processing protease CtpA/Prc
LQDCRNLFPFLTAILLWCLPAILIGQPGLSSHDRDLVLIMLRQVRQDVEKHYYDPSFHGIDLRSQFGDAERRLETVPTRADAFAILSDLLFQLDDSHTVFVPPDGRTRVDYGWHMAMVGDLPLITAVDPRSDAAAKGLASGDRVLMLNGFEPNRMNLWRLDYHYRFIRPQMQQRVSVLRPDGSARTLDIVSRVENKPVTELRDLILEIEDVLDRARDRGVAVGAGRNIFVWKMSVFGRLESVDEMTKKARGYKTLVLDLRGNGGGAVLALRALISRCFDHEVLVATRRHRATTEREVAKPARGGFTGALIVLVDSRSASAAEMFARIVQLERRGTVIGDRTSGAVMTSHLFSHKIGVSGVFYATSITIGDVLMSDGASLEKSGVEPDEIVLPRPSDLAAGRDPVLAHAIALAGGSITPEQAGRLF